MECTHIALFEHSKALWQHLSGLSITLHSHDVAAQPVGIHLGLNVLPNSTTDQKEAEFRRPTRTTTNNSLNLRNCTLLYRLDAECASFEVQVLGFLQRTHLHLPLPATNGTVSFRHVSCLRHCNTTGQLLEFCTYICIFVIFQVRGGRGASLHSPRRNRVACHYLYKALLIIFIY